MADESTMSDEKLVAAFRNGGDWAAGTLVERHGTRLASFLYARGAAEADLEDLVQESFFKAFRAIETWRGDGEGGGSFRSWLYRIALNVGRDAWRRGRKSNHITLEHEIISPEGSPDEILQATELGTMIAKELARLPRLQRDTFLLRAQQGMGYAEIARTLGTTEGAARVHYHHAVRRLREAVA